MDKIEKGNVCVCVYMFLSYWSLYYPHYVTPSCVVALGVYSSAVSQTEPSWQKIVGGQLPPAAPSDGLHWCHDWQHGVWNLAIPVLCGTALRASLCSGAPHESGRDFLKTGTAL